MYRTLPLFLLLALGLGCRPSAPDMPKGRLSAPGEGTVRLMAVKVKDTPELLHYQWSVLGERNWITPKVDAGGKATLTDVYALNDARRSGGCPTWLCDAILTKQGASWEWELRLHGSNGKTATAKGTSAENTPPQILITTDTSVNLATPTELVRLGQTTLTLTASK